ncbi:MAG: methyltransferase, partial [Gammaproteobacteria bacterium]|nr:methyltransferase [Gammaproteobacteria bacterium]
DMTVVEIWPGRGWYTEILAPALKGHGKLYAAGFCIDAKRPPEWRKNMAREMNAFYKDNPDVYGEVEVTELSVPECTDIAPAGSADMVLTFRNVHNWLKGEYEAGVFEAMHRALKPGGVLGVVEHRAAPGTSLEDMKQSGYVTEAKVMELAEAAGFKFVAKSEVNANPKDTKNHPRGVWTLPPSLRLKEVDREKYLAIGESDRMTLKFIKPELE